MFDIYLPIAQVSANLFYLLFIGLLSGFCSGLFGIGGNLITVPYLLMVGITTQVAVATATNQMTAGTVSSFLAYSFRKRVDYKFGTLLLVGGIIGTFIGTNHFNILSENGELDKTIPIMFISILLVVSATSARDAFKIIFRSKHSKQLASLPKLYKRVSFPFQTQFICSEKTLSRFSPLMLGIIGGYCVALLGLGGGFIVVPAMLYFLNIKEKYTTGTMNFLIVFTTIIATLLHAATVAHSATLQQIDLVLSFVLITSTVIGAQLGVIISTKISSDKFRLLLAATLIGISAKFAYGIFIVPGNTSHITTSVSQHIEHQNNALYNCIIDWATHHPLGYAVIAIIMAVFMGGVVSVITHWGVFFNTKSK